MRVFVGVMAFVFVPLLCVYADTIMQPEPPAHWDEHETPGFSPSIESALVHWDATPTRLASLMQQWGPAAVPAIIALYNAPGWEPFRWRMWQFLGAEPTDEARKFFIDCIQALLACDSLGHDRVLRAPESLLNDESVAILIEALRGIGTNSRVTGDWAHDLVDMLGRANRADTIAAVTDAALNGPEKYRAECCAALMSKQPVLALKTAHEAYARAVSEDGRNDLAHFVDYRGGEFRALEPMNRSIDKQALLPVINSGNYDEHRERFLQRLTNTASRTPEEEFAVWEKVYGECRGTNKLHPEPDKRVRKVLSRMIVNKLKSMNDEHSSLAKASISARIAGDLQLEHTGTALKDFVLRNRTKREGRFPYPYEEVTNVLLGYIAATDDKGVKLIADLVQDKSALYEIRRCAVIALAKCGTPRALAEADRLYAEVEKRDGIAPLDQGATFNDAMWRTMRIFGEIGASQSTYQEPPHRRGWMSQDYTEGRMGGETWRYSFEFRQVGRRCYVTRYSESPRMVP